MSASPSRSWSRRLACVLMLLSACLAAPPVRAAVPDLWLLRALREEGRQEEALARLRRAGSAVARDADLLLMEGQLLTDLRRYDEAVRVLTAAAALAPDYADVHLARARALFFAGRREDALAALAPLLAVDDAGAWLLAARIHVAAGALDRAEGAIARVRALAPDDPDGLLVAGDIARERGLQKLASAYYERVLEAPGYEDLVRRRLAGLEERKRRFRLALNAAYGDYDDDRDPWRQGSIELAWRWDERSWLRGRLDVRNRFGATDVGLFLSLETRAGEATTLELGAGGTPAADFSPRFETLLGIAHRLRTGDDGLGDTVGSARLRLKQYPEGRVATLELGVTQYFLSGRLWLHTALVQTRDEDGGHDLGLAARLDGIPSPGWRLFAGTNVERDELRRGTTFARTVFAGLAVDLDDRLRLFLDLGVTDRDDGDLRRDVGLGIVVAF
ncbi:MAG TPA: YaiO family outer membrane beta-barrel protein [Rhodospirillales bacterium]|nr:YaiO family outer membrane beta-barrel protein [Rhodospirillales bacterium]